MKKLSKISLKDAVVLDDKQLKTVFGGSGGVDHTCSGTSSSTCSSSCTGSVKDSKGNVIMTMKGTCKWQTHTNGESSASSCDCVA